MTVCPSPPARPPCANAAGPHRPSIAALIHRTLRITYSPGSRTAFASAAGDTRRVRGWRLAWWLTKGTTCRAGPVSLDADDAATDRFGHGGGAVVHVQLGEEVLQVHA